MHNPSSNSASLTSLIAEQTAETESAWFSPLPPFSWHDQLPHCQFAMTTNTISPAAPPQTPGFLSPPLLNTSHLLINEITRRIQFSGEDTTTLLKTKSFLMSQRRNNALLKACHTNKGDCPSKHLSTKAPKESELQLKIM